MVDTGDRAPAFRAPIGGGGNIALKDLKGKKVVLYLLSQGRHARLYRRGQGFYGTKTKVLRQQYCRDRRFQG